MKNFLIESLASLGTGIAVGVIFSLLKLPVPAPPVVPAVVGILGITLGYMLTSKFFL